MHKLEVVRFEFSNDCPGLADISARLDDHSEKHRIDKINWKEFSYKPVTEFCIAHSNSEIFIKYYVKEEYLKAEKSGINQDVYKDSCVEFFVSPASDGIYYNFEFNSIGALLMGSGTSRNNSKRADESVAGKIRRLGSMGQETFTERKGDNEWSLTVAIPVSVFFRHRLQTLENKTFRANFYKCGDELSRPHYLSWNRIDTDKPDFHRPDFFGEIYFK